MFCVVGVKTPLATKDTKVHEGDTYVACEEQDLEAHEICEACSGLFLAEG